MFQVKSIRVVVQNVFFLLVLLLGTSAYAQNSSPVVLAIPFTPSNNDYMLLLNIDTAEQTRITLEDSLSLVSSAAVSPDGERIAVTWRLPGGIRGVVILGLDGSVVYRPSDSQDRFGLSYGALNWLDVETISYVVYDVMLNSSEFCITHIDYQPATHCILNNQPGYADHFYVLDGTMFLFSLTDYHSPSVDWVVDVHSIYLAQHMADDTMAVTAEFPGESPALTQEKDYVAYCVANEQGFRDIYLRRIDGSDPQPLTQTQDVDECNPQWSFDLAYIAFEARDRVDTLASTPSRVCILHDQADYQCITDALQADDWRFYGTLWSPYDHRLILQSTNWYANTYQSYVYDLDTGESTPLPVLDDAILFIDDWMPPVSVSP